jgi:ribosomal protein L16/L10AE
MEHEKQIVMYKAGSEGWAVSLNQKDTVLTVTTHGDSLAALDEAFRLSTMNEPVIPITIDTTGE